MTTKRLKLHYITLFITLLSIAGHVHGQSAGQVKLRFGFGLGLEGLLPVGNTGNYQNFGLGITPRLQYALTEKLDLTFTSGIYHFLGKTFTYPARDGFPAYTARYKSDVIPVKAGARLFIGQNLYVAGEAGIGFEVAEGGGPADFLWSSGLGFATKRWDIGTRYESFSGHVYSDGVAALHVAYKLRL